MKFNQFAWELYRNSERGRSAIRKDSSLTNDFVDEEDRIVEITIDDKHQHEFGEPSYSFDVVDMVQFTMGRLNSDAAFQLEH